MELREYLNNKGFVKIGNGDLVKIVDFFVEDVGRNFGNGLTGKLDALVTSLTVPLTAPVLYTAMKCLKIYYNHKE